MIVLKTNMVGCKRHRDLCKVKEEEKSFPGDLLLFFHRLRTNSPNDLDRVPLLYLVLI